MRDRLHFSGTATFFEVLPVVIQSGAILLLLLLAISDTIYALASGLLALVWLKVSRTHIVDDHNSFLLQRKLFGHAGQWYGQENAESIYDTALAETHGIEPSVTDTATMKLSTAAAIAQMVRGVVSFVVHLYLILIVLLAIDEVVNFREF